MWISKKDLKKLVAEEIRTAEAQFKNYIDQADRYDRNFLVDEIASVRKELIGRLYEFAAAGQPKNPTPHTHTMITANGQEVDIRDAMEAVMKYLGIVMELSPETVVVRFFGKGGPAVEEKAGR